MRTDCTVMETTIHEPTESSLVWDCLRVRTRQVKPGSDFVNVSYSNHEKRAKRCAFAIQKANSKEERTVLETIDRTNRVIDQTERRIIHGESVRAGEKIVSIFEPHTEVIGKDCRETLYGHKLCLSLAPPT